MVPVPDRACLMTASSCMLRQRAIPPLVEAKAPTNAVFGSWLFWGRGLTMMRRFKFRLYHPTWNRQEQASVDFTQRLLANFSCIDRPMARCCGPLSGWRSSSGLARRGRVAWFDDEIARQ
jgi:hypothetical protein